jgi:hypothetical protein
VYIASIVLLLLVFPVASIAIEGFVSGHAWDLLFITGKWFVFWAVGIRLLVAGVRQVVQPQFTAKEIFGIQESGSFVIVRELGFANLSMGLLGIFSLFRGEWIVPAAIVGGLYYGLAGMGHLFRKSKNSKEYVAMVSDIFVFLILVVFVVKSFL